MPSALISKPSTSPQYFETGLALDDEAVAATSDATTIVAAATRAAEFKKGGKLRCLFTRPNLLAVCPPRNCLTSLISTPERAMNPPRSRVAPASLPTKVPAVDGAPVPVASAEYLDSADVAPSPANPGDVT